MNTEPWVTAEHVAQHLGVAKDRRAEAAALRQSAWATFEAALFTPTESGTA